MNKDTQIEELLDAAERQGRCAIPADANMRRKCASRFASGELINPYPLLYIRAEVWERLNPTKRKRAIVRALSTIHPTWVFAAESAICMFDIEQPYEIHPDGELTIASPARSSTYVCIKHGFVKRTLYVPDMPTTMSGGVQVTSLARTLFDCARLLPFELALPLADSAIRGGGFDITSLTQFPVSSLDDANRINAIVTHADPRSDNGAESRARAVIEEGGYLPPQLQYPFPNPNNPDFPLRVDFAWVFPDGSIIVGEYDGMAKYGATWTEVNTHVSMQCERDDHLRACGVTKIVHFNFDDVIHRERLYRKLDEAGVPRIR